jgi:8-oxo-dGTP diphosphatase
VAHPTTTPTPPAQTVLAVVLQVREEKLQALLWQRGREPFRGTWSLAGGTLGGDETLEQSILRHLASKVDVRDVAHLEQLGTWSDPARHPERRELATAYLGLVPLGIDPRVPADTRWHPVDALPETSFDHGAIVLAGRERLRGKLSYTNLGFALAPETFTLAELRNVYEAALGYELSATNLKRVLLRRGVIESTGERRAHGPAGGRPAEAFRFRTRHLEVTDPFAVLRPPA